MAKLTGNEIVAAVERGDILITPFNREQINPNSYNLRLGSVLMVLDEINLDLHKLPRAVDFDIPNDGYLLLMDNVYLGSTVEIIGSDKYVPVLDGRSTVGRYGLSIHITAGFCDLGFRGTLTLELEARHRNTRIYAGDLIAQLSFETVVGDIELYKGNYQGQCGPRGPKPLKS